MDAREGVVPDVRRDVLARDDRLDERAHLGLRGRERPCSLLFRLRCPVRRPVAVEVETFERRRDRDVHAVPVVDGPFRKDAVEVARDVVGETGDEEPRVFGVRLPRAIRIRHAHEEDASVPVDVLAVQAVLGLVARIGPDARAAEAAVGEPCLGAVRVDPWDDVERARVDRMSNARVVRVEEVVEQVERRRRPGELHGVDLRVDEHGGLLLGRSSLRVRDGADPDVASLVRLADRLEGKDRRVLRGPRLQRFGQLGVGVEAVEADAHRARA